MRILTLTSLVVFFFATSLTAADWTGFRGPAGMGVSSAKNVPIEWSSSKNIKWHTALPGPGASTPVTLGNRVFITSYSGYGLKAGQGQQDKLQRHLLCLPGGECHGSGLHDCFHDKISRLCLDPRFCRY